ncbi:hypothetical protein BJ322DRAFT_1113250 [Thelephora terrestris]|uniref:Uncharacterized protein n=1 Tax=Thelephora terrestris TaxID=56493 RepID=A0A9P6L273_9AGAM|nr:hypothetical protein BJ322DRAFT_1113250 [Thelephora terrestris]
MSIPSSVKFRSLEVQALKDPAPNTPYIFLSWQQLLHRARGKAQECHQLRRKQDALVRKVSKFTRRVADYERLTSYIAVSDYKNVSHVLQLGIKNGSSPGTVLSQLQLAIMKQYTPHPGTDCQEHGIFKLFITRSFFELFLPILMF